MLLVKYIAYSGICSRRKSEEVIKSGLVKIGGHVIKDPTYIVKDLDVVTLGKKKIVPKSFLYILLNKPAGVITSKSDPSSRETIINYLPKNISSIVDPVGRLDCNTTGALLLSNDGNFVYKLSHPKFNVKKVYHVVASRDLNEKIVEEIRKGANLSDCFIRPDKVIWSEKKPTFLTIELHGGKYRVIRRLLEVFGIFVKKLHRYSFGGITVKNTNLGTWRYLTQIEIEKLMNEEVKEKLIKK